MSTSPPLPLSYVHHQQVDLVEQMGPLPFNLDFFTDCQDMRQLLAYLDAPPNMGEEEDQQEEGEDQAGDRGRPDSQGDGEPREKEGGKGGSDRRGSGGDGGRRRISKRFAKMTEEICDVVDSYGLVSFLPLNVQVLVRFRVVYLRKITPGSMHDFMISIRTLL